VAVVERGHPGRAEALGQGHQRGVGAPQAHVGVGADQFGDALPVGAAQILDQKVADDDRSEQGGLSARAKLAVDQVGRLGHHHRAGDERAGVGL
jgi:hypothetical protein